MWLDRSLWPPCADQRVFDGQDYVMDSEPAFGFWLFPLQVFDIPSLNALDSTSDVRTCPPELGLSYMPKT